MPHFFNVFLYIWIDQQVSVLGQCTSLLHKMNELKTLCHYFIMQCLGNKTISNIMTWNYHYNHMYRKMSEFSLCDQHNAKKEHKESTDIIWHKMSITQNNYHQGQHTSPISMKDNHNAVIICAHIV
jgi:hypothetical protein